MLRPKTVKLPEENIREDKNDISLSNDLFDNKSKGNKSKNRLSGTTSN